MRLFLSGFQRGTLILSACAIICACQTLRPNGGDVFEPHSPNQTTDQRAADDNRPGNRPEHYIRPPQLQGEEPVRVAILLPFTHPSESVQKVAQAMFNAAQLAAFGSADGKYLLIRKDTKGTAKGAIRAATEAVSDGAEIVLGPLFSHGVIATASVTRPASVPMIAFSSDMHIAGDGVYLLSFPPEIEIARITDYAFANNFFRFGLLAPDSDYGQRVSQSFAQEVSFRRGTIVHEERYQQSPDAMMLPAKRLAAYAMAPKVDEDETQDQTTSAEDFFTTGGGVSSTTTELQPEQFDELVDTLFAEVSGPDGVSEDKGFQAVLMPEQGTLLRALAPLLPYYDVDVSTVKLLGVSAWNNPRLTREPALAGGWFAAPDPELAKGFKKRYKDNFGEDAPRLASLSYDAALLTARLAKNPRGNRFTPQNLTDPSGYLGADGLFRLTPAGTVERGLAILEIQPSGIKVIDPAPRSFIDFGQQIHAAPEIAAEQYF